MKYWIGTTITTLLLVFFTVTPVAALVISPARYEVIAAPGAITTTEIIVINDQNETRTFYTSFENFEAQGDSGIPKFIGAKDGLATWVSSPQSVTLKAGESKKMEMRIQVPANAEPGGYFGAIFWSTTPPVSVNSGQVTIGAKIGMLIFLSVTGDVKEEAGLLDFHVKENQWFHRALPVGFTYRFSNDGGDRVKPVGTISIRSVLGWKVASVDANPSEGNVLPRTIRKFSPVWQKKDSIVDADSETPITTRYSFFGSLKNQWRNFAIGFFRAKLSAQFGTNEKMINSNSIYFVVFPVELVLVTIGGCTALFFVLRQGIRRYNKRLIEKVKAGMI